MPGGRYMMVKDKRGSVLVMVMLYTLVLIILGTSILGVAASEYIMEMAHRKRVKSYYIAEAGIEKAIYHITQMNIINPETIRGARWDMGAEDIGLVEPGARGDFTVTVKEAALYDVIYTDEGEDKKVHKRIFDIVIRSLAHYNGTPAVVEAHVLAEDYEEKSTQNKVQIYHWRQVGRVEDED
jgi:hypothetical protein